MALNLRSAIAGLRAQLAQVEASIADFERLRRAEEELRREKASKRLAKKNNDPDTNHHSAVGPPDYAEASHEVSSVIWRQ